MQSESTECGDIVVGGYLGAAPSPRFLEAVRRGERAGAILFKRNGRAPEELFAHTTALVAAAGERPLVVAVDQEGGRVERVGPPVLHLPPALRLAASAPARRDPGFLERVALAQGEQLAAIGFTTSFAPVLDVHSEPANPIIGDRAFGETADAAATGALAFARGLARARHPLGIGAPDALPVPAGGLQRAEPLLDPDAQPVPDGSDLVGGQIGQHQPRRLLIGRPVIGTVEARVPARHAAEKPLQGGAITTAACPVNQSA